MSASAPQDPEAPARSSRPPSRRSPARRIGLALATLFLSLLFAELGWRAWCTVRGETYAYDDAVARVHGLASSMTETLPRARAVNEPTGTSEEAHVLSPYYGLDFSSSLDALEVEAQHFRRGDYDDAFVVVLMGGSVSAQTSNEQHDHLVELLAADPRLSAKRVVVIGQGRGAFKQPQPATLLVYLFALGWRPDAVVEIDGFNEVAIPWAHAKMGVHPLQPMWGQWSLIASQVSDRGREVALAADCLALQREASSLADRTLANGTLRSALLGRWSLARLSDLQRRWSAAQTRFSEFLASAPGHDPARGPRFELEGDDVLACSVACWSESSRSMHAACAERGVVYLHVLQPTLHDPGSKPLTADEIANGGAPKAWIQGSERGYPSLRMEGRRLAEQGVSFVDLSLLFRDLSETTYYDLCHFRGRGQELFAERIAQELRAALPDTMPARRAWSVRDTRSAPR